MRKNIITLAGPPCSGKSTAGKILSVSLQAEFIDIDCLIETETERTIEWIFSHRGEQAFRVIEKRILHRVIRGNTCRTVIALGGGTLLDRDSRQLVESKTILFTLFASVETLWTRNNAVRPLAQDPVMLKNLMKERKAHYLSLGNPVNTENKTPDQLAELIRREALPLLSPEDLPS